MWIAMETQQAHIITPGSRWGPSLAHPAEEEGGGERGIIEGWGMEEKRIAHCAVPWKTVVCDPLQRKMNHSHEQMGASPHPPERHASCKTA